MRNILAISLFFVLLVGCGANNADRAAHDAAATPLLYKTHGLYSSSVKGVTVLSHPVSGYYDQMPLSNVDQALINAGYFRYIYAVTKGGFDEKPVYPRFLALTEKGVDQHWSCTTVNGWQTCLIPVGTIQVGSAKMTQANGSDVVEFDCTATPTDIGKQISGAIVSSNWSYTDNGGSNASWTFGDKHVCDMRVGPDGNVMQ